MDKDSLARLNKLFTIRKRAHAAKSNFIKTWLVIN